VESMPGDGGRFVRAAGAQAVVVSQGDRTVIQLPSGQFRTFHPDCRATIGAVAGAGRGDKPFYRAGKKWFSFRSFSKAYFIVRGVAMNPVDHPHGGGSHQHVGKPSTVGFDAPPGRKVGRMSPQPKRLKEKRRRRCSACQRKWVVWRRRRGGGCGSGRAWARRSRIRNSRT